MNPEEIESIAMECGYIKRERKISGYDLLESGLFSGFEPDKLSLNDHCTYLLVHKGVRVSNQAVDKKFTKGAVDFLKKVLATLLARNIKTVESYPMLSEFGKVRIKDSVCFQVPDGFKERYPGSGGGGSRASVRIQFEYDLLANSILELKVGAFNSQDVKDALLTVGDIDEGDLVVRDLGYVTIGVLEKIAKEREAFYINRLNYTDVYIKKGEGEFEKLDFKKIEKVMRDTGQSLRVEEVYLGAEKGYKTDLVIETVPEDVKKERLRKRHATNKRKGRGTPQKALDREGLNLLVTNVPGDKIPREAIREVYGIRWQVEMVFKVWKSIGGLHKVKDMGIYRFEFYLFAKLIFLVVNWQVLTILQGWTLKGKQYISYYKMLKAIHIAGPDKVAVLVDKMFHVKGGFKIVIQGERKGRVNKSSIKESLKHYKKAS